MERPKGGRCKSAPYTSKAIRVPAEIYDQIQELIGRYLEWLDESGSPDCSIPPRLLDILDAGITDNGEILDAGINEDRERILERLKNGEEVTEKEVALIAGVTQKAVNDASKKRNEYFIGWSVEKCGIELQCRDLNAGRVGDHNRKLRYSLIQLNPSQV